MAAERKRAGVIFLWWVQFEKLDSQKIDKRNFFIYNISNSHKKIECSVTNEPDNR